MSDAPEIDRSHSRRMQAAIKKGNDERDCGESITYTSKALNDITESALNGMRSDKPITPDVLP